ncbi:CDP-alcohol phosphatidyltransferase family protein [Jiella sp. M17.18]|uniref:CDP-alcohol phosphatidyltransferase family protein n=1 Tax=Jiella sp. M17.18 TaxID=3234247 RepID=UPI0034E03802
MLDSVLRKRIDPPVERLAAGLVRLGVGADMVTVTGFVIGLAAAVAIALDQLTLALFLILFSRLADGLDGAIARQTVPSDFGGFLDITFDFVFYGAIPVAFAILDPGANALAAAILVATFYANGASVLAFAVMAEKRGLAEAGRPGKSLLFTTGLAEASETIAAFVLFCLFPQWFPVIAAVFAAMTAWTFVSRVWLAAKTFG